MLQVSSFCRLEALVFRVSLSEVKASSKGLGFRV